MVSDVLTTNYRERASLFARLTTMDDEELRKRFDANDQELQFIKYKVAEYIAFVDAAPYLNSYIRDLYTEQYESQSSVIDATLEAVALAFKAAGKVVFGDGHNDSAKEVETQLPDSLINQSDGLRKERAYRLLNFAEQRVGEGDIQSKLSYLIERQEEAKIFLVKYIKQYDQRVAKVG